MAKMIIVEGNSNEKDNVRAYMVKGESGNDGFSPIVAVSRGTGYASINITDAEGTKSVNVYDGELTSADIVDNLTSIDTSKVLSAKQGSVLKGLVDDKADSDDVYTKTESDNKYKLLGDFAVLTGSFEISDGIGSKSLTFPTGFTKDNCVVVSQMYQNSNSGLNRYTSGYMADTQMVIHGMLVMLGKPDGTDDTKIYIQSEGIDTSGTFTYKIVLMKVS